MLKCGGTGMVPLLYFFGGIRYCVKKQQKKDNTDLYLILLTNMALQ